jgi:sugar diacid utilization regulator
MLGRAQRGRRPPDHELVHAPERRIAPRATLDALAEHASLRRAAAALHVHHSTLQERAVQLEHALGYPLDTAAGHNRLYLALVLRRLHHNGDLPIDGFP